MTGGLLRANFWPMLAMLAAVAFAPATLARVPASSTVDLAQPGLREAPAGIGVGRAPRRETAAQRCRKWRRIADRLGETYAGRRLRDTMVAKVCAFAGITPPQDGVWAWPWDKRGELVQDLPPRVHGAFGAWTIRCGNAGRRERCALIQELAANIGAETGGTTEAGIVAHFVIDEIGGELRLLFRLVVERVDPTWYTHTGVADPPGVRMAIGGLALREPFDDCGVLACAMEAAINSSSRIGARLVNGRSLQLEFRPNAGLVLRPQVRAEGFQQGLRELMRLKRSEQRPIAGN